MRLLACLILGLVSAGCRSPRAGGEGDHSGGPKTALEFFDRGFQRHRGGDLEGAIADYSEAIRLDPTDPAAWNNRGLARTGKGEQDASLREYDSHRGLPQGAGDLDGAIGDFDEAIRLDPENPQAWNNRALARKGKGDVDGAMKDFGEVIRIDPKDSAALRNRAILQFGAGSFRASLDDCIKGLAARKPGESFADYAAILGMVCRLRLGEHTPSTAELDAIFEGRDGKARGDWPATVAAFLRGSITEEEFLSARESVSEKGSRKQSCEAWFYAGEVRLAKGDSANAKWYFEKCVSTGVTTFSEFGHAKAELARLGAK